MSHYPSNGSPSSAQPDVSDLSSETREQVQVPEAQGDDHQNPTGNLVTDQHSRSSDNIENYAPVALDDLWKESLVETSRGPTVKSLRKPTRQKNSEKAKTAFLRSSSGLREFIEVHTLDGRAITIVNSKTQTDWEWVEQKLSGSCEVQSGDIHWESVDTDSEIEETEVETTQDGPYGIPCVGPPSILAYKPESKELSCFEKKIGLTVTSPIFELPWDHVLCDYCLQLSKPFVNRLQLENNPDLGMLFCCEWAQKMREFLLQEERILAAAEARRKIDVGPHPPFMNKQQKRAAKEQAEQRLREWEFKRVQRSGNQNQLFSGSRTPEISSQKMGMPHGTVGLERGGVQTKTISYRLSSEVCVIKDEPQFAHMDIIDTTGLFTLQEEAESHQRRNHIIVKLYPSGKPFITLYPDETGNVFYPSGNVAIIISSVGTGDFTFVVMEDKDKEPKIRAIFTNRGQSTCYHPNGWIWVNLTPIGGFCCSETGALRRRWSWLDLEPHIQAAPFQPLCLALGPLMSVRVHSQKQMYLTFSYRQSSVRFNVGAKLKLTHPKGLELLEPDIMQIDLQIKSLEIYSLLEHIQICMAYQRSANPQNIKPPYSLFAQMQRLRKQMEKSPRKIQLLMGSKESTL